MTLLFLNLAFRPVSWLRRRLASYGYRSCMYAEDMPERGRELLALAVSTTLHRYVVRPLARAVVYYNQRAEDGVFGSGRTWRNMRWQFPAAAGGCSDDEVPF